MQTKLHVGPPHDAYEQEADLVANQVMRMPEPGGRAPLIQKKPRPRAITPVVWRQIEEEEEEEEEETPIQAKRISTQFAPRVRREPEEEEEEEEAEEARVRVQAKRSSHEPPTVSPAVHDYIRGLSGWGQPLTDGIRHYFEPRFGYSFDRVRIHTNVAAQRSAGELRARAYTVGRDIVFGARQYDPNSIHGQRLLAHELTHVVQQSGGAPSRVRRSPADAELAAAGIDPRTFAELWAEFDRLRRTLQNERALALVPDLLVRMGPEDAVEHAADLAFWLLDQGEVALARRALDELESGWWIRYILREGPGVPSELVSFGGPPGPEALIERGEALARAGSHEDAKRMLAIAYLFLEMQREREMAEHPSARTEPFPDLAIFLWEAVHQAAVERIDSRMRRIRNFYPSLAAKALAAGRVEGAQQLAQVGDELLATIRERTLARPEVVGPTEPAPEPPRPRPGGRGAVPTPSARPTGAPPAEPEAEPAPPPGPARAATEIIESPPPFTDALIVSLPGFRFFHAKSARHAVAGNIGAAINLSRVLFGVSGGVVAQWVGGDERRFVVSGLYPPFTMAALRVTAVPGSPGRIQAQGTIFLRAGAEHVVRAVVTPEAILVPGGALEPVDAVALLNAVEAEQRADVEAGRAAVPREVVRERVFGPIDRLLASGSSSDLEAAAGLLAQVNATAFAALEWRERARYLQALVDAWTLAPQELAIVEILKTVQTPTELNAIIFQLQQAGIWSQLIDDVDHELWSLVVAIGRNLGSPGPVTLTDVANLLLEARLLRPFPGIAIGPEGAEISLNALQEVEQAGLAFIRFLETTFDSIVMLITEPGKLIEGLGQLTKMIVMWKLADFGYPPAIQFRARILAQVNQQVIWGFKGAQLLADRLGQIASRVKWALVWEIASLFVGVGEIRAALRGLGLTERLTAVARFLRLANFAGRVAEGERVATQVEKLARVFRRSSRLIESEDEVLRLLAHLPEEDAQRLGRVLEGVDIDDSLDLARLAAAHPELGEVARGSLREIEALSALAAKAGGLSDEVVAAARQLRRRGLDADQLAELTRLIPDGEGVRFAHAMRSLKEVPTISRAFLEAIAQSPTRMDAVRVLGGNFCSAAFTRAGGELGTFDGILGALGNRRPTMNPADFQKLLDDLATGDSVRWRRFLAPEAGLRRPAPGNSHALLTSPPRPFTFDAAAQRYTRVGHGGSTEIVEVYGDGRIRFWREKGGNLTDEAVQYNVALHGSQPTPTGLTTLQSNHGIQDAWVRQHFGDVIGVDDVPAILLTNSRTGSQHGTISALQRTDAATRASTRAGPWDASYSEMRQALIDHHRAAGVPEPYIQRLLEESDRVFLPFRTDPRFAHLFPPQP